MAGSPSPDPVSTTLNVASSALDVGGKVMSMFGGDDSQSSGYTLPPEYELQYFQQFQQNMQAIQSAYQQANQLANIYNSRVQLSMGAQQGKYSSSEALGMINASNIQLAHSLGMSAQDLVKNGFIDSGSAKDLESYQQAAQGKLEDPALVAQQKEQRRQLQQQLQRDGVPLAQQAIALQQFDSQARQQSFQNSLQMGQGILQGLTARQGVQQQGFNQALGSLQAGQGQIANYQQGLMGVMGLQQGLRGEALGNYADMGKYQFSDASRYALSSGLIGPGTFYQQTGVGEGALHDYRNWVGTQERINTTGQSQEGYKVGNLNYSPQNYAKFKGYQTSQFHPIGLETNPTYSGYTGPGGTNLAQNRAFVKYT